MGNSKLLFNKRPLIVDIDLATAVGLNESIIIQQIHYWLITNEEANRNLHDGFYWTFNSYPEWQKQFPFWSESTVKRAITKLEKQGYLISGNYNKLKIDRTKWYRINYNKLQTSVDSPLGQNDPIIESICADAPSQYDLTNTIDYPEITTETTLQGNSKNSINKGNSKEISMQFKDYVKKYPEVIILEDIIPAVEYYMATYKAYTGKKHPNLKESQWLNVTNKILYVKGEYNHEKYMELYELEKIVDKHFVTEYENCDWNILHFVHGDIIKNRFYEECEF